MSRIGLRWMLLLALAWPCPPAAAEDRAAARTAYVAGAKFYDLNQFAEALESFKRAYWNYEDPVILYNIAQCHRALGHKKDAIDFYRSYLRKAPNPRNREDVQRIIGDLESALERERAVTIAPPQGTLPAETRPTPAPVAAPPAAPEPVAASAPPTKPVWKRAWLWGVVGGVLAAGVVVGVGVGVGTASHAPSPSDGTVRF